MIKEFNLSEKIESQDDDTMEEYEIPENQRDWIFAKDVKEFIKLLKEIIVEECTSEEKFIPENIKICCEECQNILDMIDLLAGEEFMK